MLDCPICNFNYKFLCSKKDNFGGFYNYYICEKCGFIFDHDLAFDNKRLQDKVGNLYKEGYFEEVDRGWKMRGDGMSKLINQFLKIYKVIKFKNNLTVLDYGGGNGYITSKIGCNFNVLYYDKYEKPSYKGSYKVLTEPEKADIIYAVELVEHVTNIDEWNLLKRLCPNVFIFTTCLSDLIDNKELSNWSYLNPDAGHVAIYSSNSLYLLAKKYGFFYFFFPNISCHIFLKNKFLSRINFVAVEYFIYNILRKIKNTFK